MEGLLVALLVLSIIFVFILRKFPVLYRLTRWLILLYWRMLRVIFKWLYRPDMERRGGGALVPPRVRYHGENNPEEDR